MSEQLRAQLKKAMLATKYDSTSRPGTKRGFMEHHIEPLLDAVMKIVLPEGSVLVTIREDGIDEDEVEVTASLEFANGRKGTSEMVELSGYAALSGINKLLGGKGEVSIDGKKVG
jgi:hypothetical protein